MYKTSHPKANDTVNIHKLNQAYDPTAYVIIFPTGDNGYSIPPPIKTNKRPLTAMEMVRCSFFNTVHRSGRLYHEFICDMYSKVEGARLKFLKENQAKLQVELYSGLQGAMAQVSTG